MLEAPTVQSLPGPDLQKLQAGATGAAEFPAQRPDDPADRVMWITPDRVFYAGLLGTMSTRTMGGWLVYASLGAPLHVAVPEEADPAGCRGQVPDGEGQGRDRRAGAGTGLAWSTGLLAVVPPYMPHRVVCDQRMVCTLTLEPDSLAADQLPAVLQGAAGIRQDAAALALWRRLRQAHDWLRTEGRGQVLPASAFDAVVLGQTLAPRQVSPRVRQVLDAMRADPSQNTSAAECAAAVGLSTSRFLHLFKAEVGSSFRAVRTWKRARSLLHHVTRPANLAHLALDSGYPDSTHFSHSIRQVYGLSPRDLFAGSRRLTLLGQPVAGGPAPGARPGA